MDGVASQAERRGALEVFPWLGVAPVVSLPHLRRRLGWGPWSCHRACHLLCLTSALGWRWPGKPSDQHGSLANWIVVSWGMETTFRRGLCGSRIMVWLFLAAERKREACYYSEILQLGYLCILCKTLIFSQQSLQLLRALQIKAFKG